MPPRHLAQSIFLIQVIRIVQSAPAATSHKRRPPTHSFTLSTAHLAIIISITVTLIILYTIKLCFLRARTLAPEDFLLGQSINPRTPSSMIPAGTQGKPGSPFLLGFLGSPARELHYVSSDLLRLSPSGRLLKRQCTRHPLKGAMAMALRWIKEPGPSKSISRFDTFSTPSAHATCPTAYADLASGLGGGTTEVEVRRTSLPTPFGRFPRQHPADIDSSERSGEDLLPLCDRDIDRRQPTSAFDTPDVRGDLSFSASFVTSEGYSPWLAPLASLQLGPAPGYSFLENLESNSPMPLTFRLPCPLLPAKRKPGPSKRRSPLRSILLPQTLLGVRKVGGASKGYSDELPIPLFSDASPIDKGKAASYKDLGLGRPSQRHGPQSGSFDSTDPSSSPVSLHEPEADTENIGGSPTLELILEQLVQATSDWDDSIFIDDKFKDLLGSTKRSDYTSNAEYPSAGAASCDGLPLEPQNVELPTLGDLDDEGNLYPNLGSSHVLRDRTRDLLFSIPEEDAISFTDIVIQTY